jgi:carboxylesterase
MRARRRSALILGVLAATAWRVANNHRLRRTLRRALDRFTPMPGLHTFVEARPRLSPGFPRVAHAVLLLHGYSGSPYEFDYLLRALDQAGIPYYAPLLTGHGLDDLHLFSAVKAADWLRDAVLAYGQLAALADEISVLGHSTGATLAIYVAQVRRVKHLLLSAPNLYPGAADRRARRALTTPMLGTLITRLIPIRAKPVRPGRVSWSDTRDPEAARASFNYPVLPTTSIRAQWLLQQRVDLAAARWATLTLLSGQDDQTVDMARVRHALDALGARYADHTFAQSGHNAVMDYDKAAFARTVLDVLAHETHPSP